MPASGNTLTIKLVDNSTCVLTLSTADWPDAQGTIMGFTKSGGFFDSLGLWHPVSAILSVTIS